MSAPQESPVLQALLERASVRAFDPRALPPEIEDAILVAAMQAPTAGNMQLYTILRVHSEETRRTLAKTCDDQPFIAEAPLCLVFLADFTRWSGLYDAAGVPELAAEQGIAWQGPTIADFLLCCCDAMAAAQNAVIAAQALGVGSCYIGDIMEQYETHRELFSLPPQAFPLAMLVLGYPKAEIPPPRSRFERRFVVHEETYRAFGPEELLDMARRGHEGIVATAYVRKHFLRKNGAPFFAEMTRSASAALDAFLNLKTGEEEP
jgi:nitroreductase